MLVGVTGTLCSGKSTVVGILEEQGFTAISLSDSLRERCAHMGAKMDHDSLMSCARELRTKFGPAALMEEALNHVALEPGDYVIDGIRTPAEVERMRKEKDVFLIGVDADIEIRFGRARDRQIRTGRQEHAGTKQEFIAHHEQKTDDPISPQPVKLLGMADVVLNNAATIDALKMDVLAALDTFKKGGHVSSGK